MSIDPVSRLEQAIDLAEMSHNVSLDGIRVAIKQHVAEEVARETELREARALNVEWAKKAETWLATPEAAQRLQGYRELGQQVAKAQNECDEARAEVERLRKTLDEIATYWNGSHRPAETLGAAEWTRGVAEEALRNAAEELIRDARRWRHHCYIESQTSRSPNP